MNIPRCLRLIHRAVDAFELKLPDRVVLTEAATGPFALTAAIAGLAGAKRVICLARDSPHGPAADAIAITRQVCRTFGVEDRLVTTTDREHAELRDVDIITNLGFVRPIDSHLLSAVNTQPVVSLMCEPWEIRPADVDLADCRRHGIPVLGTNEHHHLLQTFAYVGHLALRMLYESQVEVFQSSVIVVGGGEFGQAVRHALTSAGANVVGVDPTAAESLGDERIVAGIPSTDAIVIAEHEDRRPVIGDGLTAEELAAMNPGIVVCHIAGGTAGLSRSDLRVIPQSIRPAGTMSVTTAWLGPRPLIDLHTAGLKVGELLASCRTGNAPPEEVEAAVLARTNLALPSHGHCNSAQTTAGNDK